jgi:uncharacterized Zn finger protein
MSIPPIDLSTIRRNSTPQSFSKGEDYYRSGAVSSLTLRGTLLQAEVEGNEPLPYEVTVELEEGEIGAYCTCPYDWGGWCKHIVAVLLAGIDRGDTIKTRPSLDELLDRVDSNQAKQLLRTIIAQHPDLIDDFERQVSLITATTAKSAPNTPKTTPSNAIDPDIFRRQVKQVFRRAVNAWEDGYEEDPVTEEILDLVAQAEDFSQAGDGDNAIAVLTGITQGCVDDWEDVDNYGADSEEIVTALGEAWAEAILTAELTPARQTQLHSQLETWQSEWGQDFSIALTALAQGWSYPPLQRVLAGEITKSGAWAGDAPPFADDLAAIRLGILERQERYQEYLYLAEAESQIEAYLTMLAQLGRIEEAMTAARNLMTTGDEAFALAKILQERGANPQALAIAQTGLTLPSKKLYDFAIWTSELAETLNDELIALTARVTAFKTKPSFPDYRKLEQLAGEDWTVLRIELLEILEQHTGWGFAQDRVSIFLQEGEIDRAIEVVKNLSYYESSLIHRVMDAAISHRPDWAIENGRTRAEEIMNRGKAEAYHHAVDWLQKVKAAYLESGRGAQWSAYYQELKQIHARKYKLMGMLQKL